MKFILLIISIFIFLVSCKNSTQYKEAISEEVSESNFDKINKLEWILGTWIHNSNKEFSQEQWKKINDSTYKAFSYTTVENDTVFAEELQLQQKSDKLYLTVIAYNQNEDKPVTFTLIPSEGKEFTFENKKHDFPQRITYSNPVSDSIHAWISGNVEGKERKIDFYFERLKE